MTQHPSVVVVVVVANHIASKKLFPKLDLPPLAALILILQVAIAAGNLTSIQVSLVVIMDGVLQEGGRGQGGQVDPVQQRDNGRVDSEVVATLPRQLGGVTQLPQELVGAF